MDLDLKKKSITLPPTIMEVENGYHDYGRKGIT